MKTSSKWLQTYIDIPWPATDLAYELTMAGLEVEGIEVLGALPESVVAARIVERSAHPDADKLSCCKVDDGSGELLDVVCGAPNCDAGQTAVLARVGTVLPDGTKLRKAKIRGQVSLGMLCARDELGLGSDHSGIMILPDDVAAGTPLTAHLEPDTVIDWEVTPNRPDWLSHLGIANEIATLSGNELRLPATNPRTVCGPAIGAEFKVDVQAPELCPRYTARLIRKVKIGPSPDWLQERLRAVGLRPINNVVDITNFVLFECGQPLHAFDADKVAGKQLLIRRALTGETMQTLDGQTHELNPENLVIADAERSVALAGIMGGGNSEIEDDTSNVLLESAAFDATNIRASARQLGLSTDSSYRFERGVDIEMVEFASLRAAHLICELAGGELASGEIDLRRGPYVAPQVRCRYQRACNLIGIELAPAQIKSIFARLRLQIISEDSDSCTVGIPSCRLDLHREADLIEEIARVHGLNRIPAKAAAALVGGAMATDSYYQTQSVRAQLLALGLCECVTYSFENQADSVRGTGYTEDDLARLSNPLSQDLGALRPSLVPGMLRTVAHNLAHGNANLALFELGRVYSGRAGEAEERTEVAIALSGQRYPQRHSEDRDLVYDFYDLSGLLADWLASQRLPDWRLQPTQHAALAPGQAAEILVRGCTVGVLGQAAPELLAGMRIVHPLLLAIVQLDALLPLWPPPATVSALPQYPGTSRDVAFVCAEDLLHQAVVDVIRSCEVKLLEDVQLFDIFRDEQALGAGRKSMAYSLTYRSPDRTLRDEEVNQAHTRICRRLTSELPLEIR